jgi:hypothetical protein
MLRSAFSPKNLTALGSLATLAVAALVPSSSWACACGCGVFEIGTSSMFPSGSGGMFFLEDDFMDQNKNYRGSAETGSEDNSDKEIRTNFFKAGAQYMFNRSWGVQVEVPYWTRYFRTVDDSGNLDNFNHSALGDIRLTGIYTGFSEDMSTGITYGVKLPTGNWNDSGFDRDTQIGTGSTDILLGFYHLGSLALNGDLGYLVQVSLDQPVFTQGGYLPGHELDFAGGIFYQGIKPSTTTTIIPSLELIASTRGADNGGGSNIGSGADPSDSGYERLIAAPGIEADLSRFRIYADVELPFYQYMNGNQLVASALYKAGFSVGF